MNKIDRRTFAQALISTGAVANVLPLPLTAEQRSQPRAKARDVQHPDTVLIENRTQQLELSRAGGKLTFRSYIRQEQKWMPATVPEVPLIAGPSFPLSPTRLERSGPGVHAEGAARAEGVSGRPVEYAWRADVDQPRPDSWFRFRVTLTLPEPLRLRQSDFLEPQIVVWLSSTSTLIEGQSASWRRILLEQPTQNSLGAYGNDLPSVYLLDGNHGIETMLYFDMSDMAWMSLENIPRFLGYRCSTVSRLEDGGANQRLGIGLIALQSTGNRLPAGDIQFTYWLMQRAVSALLNEQQAVTRWMEALLPLFEQNLAWPSCSGTWSQLAQGAVENVQQKDSAVFEVNGHLGLRAYVKATSELWHEEGKSFELMTLADVLWPAHLYLRLRPSEAFSDLVKRLTASLPFFYHNDTKTTSNDLVRSKEEVADSWYPFENSLVKYPLIGMLAGSSVLAENFLRAFDSAVSLAHRYHYLFPIYYRPADGQQFGAGTNYAVGGLYAWGALIAHHLTGEARYRAEASRALEVMHTVRAARLFHEPQELAFGALAAAELGMPDVARYLLYEQLRMFYWYSDPSQKSHNIRGMVQAAASILYPAFKENVEAILPWTGIFKRGIAMEPLLRFMDQQRRSNFYFFDHCGPPPSRAGGTLHGTDDTGMHFIPFENLGTLELGGQTGNVGKEIYGTGEVLWMYLMFEGLGTVADRELMLVNLDLMDFMPAGAFPPRELNFILYNPAGTARTATVTIPPALGKPVQMTADGQPVSGAIAVPGKSSMRIAARY
jgi:hypothetical protein